MRRGLILLSLLATFPACASRPEASPEYRATLQAKADACRAHAPGRYSVDRWGSLQVVGRSVTGHLSANAFFDCVYGRGQWKDPITTTGTTPAPSAPSATPPSSPAAVSPTPSRTAQRLQELEALRQKRLISDEEYQATRKRILDGL